MKITSKLPEIGTNIFTIMSKLAADYKAINLGQGFPDFNTDEKLQALVTKAMSDGFNQYPFMTGVQSLREVISQKVMNMYGQQYNVDTDITITSGATEAIMSIMLATVGAGDEVIVLEPSYDSYLPAIKLSGANAVSVPMDPPTETRKSFQVDWDRVKANITPKTREKLPQPLDPTKPV